MMGQIFENATKVFVSLGPHENNSELLFESRIGGLIIEIPEPGKDIWKGSN
jgi:hypothetical protein